MVILNEPTISHVRWSQKTYFNLVICETRCMLSVSRIYILYLFYLKKDLVVDRRHRLQMDFKDHWTNHFMSLLFFHWDINYVLHDAFQL